MRKTLFFFGIVLLVSAASTFAQTTNPSLLKNNNPQRPQTSTGTSPKIVGGNPSPNVRPDINKIAKKTGESPQPSARPDVGKGGKTAGKSPPQVKYGETPVKMAPSVSAKGKQTPHHLNNGMIGAARMHRPPRVPSNMDAGDPLTQLYQAHKLLNRLSATEADDSRKAAYGTAKRLVGKAIRIINGLQSGA
ncbi:MAG: hypothetical protein ABSF43_15850 [Rectinemataceae bacterium]|jgi:hypothetical protein